jgi:xylan 1,4-beta-xylosidase
MIPYFWDNGRIPLSIAGPRLPEQSWPTPAARDDFDAQTLGVDGNFLRWPREGDWSLLERPGFLRLHGHAARLDDGSGVAFLGRRQEHQQCEVATMLDFTPQEDGQEAGLAVWMNPEHHYEIAVTMLQGVRQATVRRRIGSLIAVVASEPRADGPVTLRVKAIQEEGGFFAPPATYNFSYALADDELRELASGEARYLASEVAGGFTGVMFALYATANNEQQARFCCKK